MSIEVHFLPLDVVTSLFLTLHLLRSYLWVPVFIVPQILFWLLLGLLLTGTGVRTRCIVYRQGWITARAHRAHAQGPKGGPKPELLCEVAVSNF